MPVASPPAAAPRAFLLYSEHRPTRSPEPRTAYADALRFVQRCARLVNEEPSAVLRIDPLSLGCPEEALLRALRLAEARFGMGEREGEGDAALRRWRIPLSQIDGLLELLDQVPECIDGGRAAVRASVSCTFWLRHPVTGAVLPFQERRYRHASAASSRLVLSLRRRSMMALTLVLPFEEPDASAADYVASLRPHLPIDLDASSFERCVPDATGALTRRPIELPPSALELQPSTLDRQPSALGPRPSASPEPAVEASRDPEPIVQEPLVEEPLVQELAAEEPAAEVRAAEEPAVQEPALLALPAPAPELAAATEVGTTAPSVDAATEEIPALELDPSPESDIQLSPAAESREPTAESREPAAESLEPTDESREPRAESREPLPDGAPTPEEMGVEPPDPSLAFESIAETVADALRAHDQAALVVSGPLGSNVRHIVTAVAGRLQSDVVVLGWPELSRPEQLEPMLVERLATLDEDGVLVLEDINRASEALQEHVRRFIATRQIGDVVLPGDLRLVVIELTRQSDEGRARYGRYMAARRDGVASEAQLGWLWRHAFAVLIEEVSVGRLLPLEQL